MNFVFKLHILVLLTCLQSTVFDNLQHSKPRNYTLNKVITVSNRLMTTIVDQNGKFLLSNSAGGLATAVSSLHNDTDNLWIGWPGLDIRGLQNQSTVTKMLFSYNLIPVFLNEDDIVNYYEGYSGDLLWPVMHSMTKHARYETRYWSSYYNVNRKFADTVLKYAKNDDVIFIHDFHLSLVPGMIREKLPNVSIAYFQHVPFPNFNIFKNVPMFSKLLRGILGADIVAFHTKNDTNNFLKTVFSSLPLLNKFVSQENEFTQRNKVLVIGEDIVVNDRLVKINAIPLGIDDKKFSDLVDDVEVKKNLMNLQEEFRNIELILSVGRLDYIKGIIETIKSFQLFLILHPQYVEKVTLYLVVVPSRQRIKTYHELKINIDKLVQEINFKYNINTTKWKPISYTYSSIPIKLLSALYTFANVCIITSFADGMNLVSKEFVASRPKLDGVLVLSKMAGAAIELKDGAVLVDPNDIGDIANGIYQAFSMELEEQNLRMRIMREVVSKNNAKNWENVFMRSLDKVKSIQKSI